jgi:hypothetical protein
MIYQDKPYARIMSMLSGRLINKLNIFYICSVFPLTFFIIFADYFPQKFYCSIN